MPNNWPNGLPRSSVPPLTSFKSCTLTRNIFPTEDRTFLTACLIHRSWRHWVTSCLRTAGSCCWTGTPRGFNAEGRLEWVAREHLLDLPLWEGDRYFLPLVFDRAVRQFHGVMPYRDGKPLSWSFSLL